MSQSDDMAAINSYILRTPARNPEAEAEKVAFMNWYQSLGFLDRSFNSSIYDQARVKRDAFNAANGTPTPATGLTTEQMQGQPRRNYAAHIASPGPHPTIRLGSRGSAVREWQGIIGVTQDGNFGHGTRAATVAWQAKNGLKPDGIVGPLTWGAALGQGLATPSVPIAASPVSVPISTPAAVTAAATPNVFQQAAQTIKAEQAQTSPPVSAPVSTQRASAVPTVAAKPASKISTPVKVAGAIGLGFGLYEIFKHHH